MKTSPLVVGATLGLLGLSLALAWLLLVSSNSVQAADASPCLIEHTVCPTGPPNCAYATIQEAVDAAHDGTIIKVAAGVYADVHTHPAPDSASSTSVITQVVLISKTVTIRGGYTAPGFSDPPDPGANPTTLDAEELGRVIYVPNNASPIIEGLHLTAGTADNGAGIYNGGALTVRNCIIYRNHASGASISPKHTSGRSTIGRGGGIYNDGVLFLRESIIHDNYAIGGFDYAYGASAFGGGIYNSISGSVTIEDSTLRGNGAGGSSGLIGGSGTGGGIYTEGGLTIRNCEFGHNVARGGDGVFAGTGYGVGGGISISSSGSVVIEDSTLRENLASGGDSEPGIPPGNGIGGGIDNRGTLVLRRSILSGNDARGGDGQEAGSANGGGIHNSGILMVQSTAFCVNVAVGGGYYDETEPWADTCGGAIFNSGTLTMENSTLSGNSAQQGSSPSGPVGRGLGGGMYNQIYSSPTLSNCTFENNSATEGGGIFNLPGSSPTSPALSNSILWNNAPDQIANPGVPDLLNPTISYSDVQGSGGSSSWDSSLGTDGGGNIDANPLFVDADTGDLRLQLASPAIDAGDNSAVPPGVTTDLVGQPRFVDVPSVTDTGNGDAPLIDMGAYEARYFALTVTAAGSGSGTISSDPPGINCGSDCSEELFQATIITLTASTDISSTFRGWSGACSGSSECMVAMNSDQVVTGSFAREDAGYVYLPLTVRESPQ